MAKWSSRSLAAYETLHPSLQLLCDKVLQIHDCSIVYGYRSKELQDKLHAEGKSKLKFPQSKHNTFPSEAVDLIPYVKGQDPYHLPLITHFAGIVLGVARELYNSAQMRYRIRWGGNWSTQPDNPSFTEILEQGRFFDAAHYELYME